MSLNDEFWDLAKFMKKYVTEHTNEAYQVVGMLNYVPNLSKFFKERVMVHNGRHSSVSVTNLGRIEFDRICGNCK